MMDIPVECDKIKVVKSLVKQIAFLVDEVLIAHFKRGDERWFDEYVGQDAYFADVAECFLELESLFNEELDNDDDGSEGEFDFADHENARDHFAKLLGTWSARPALAKFFVQRPDVRIALEETGSFRWDLGRLVRLRS